MKLEYDGRKKITLLQALFFCWQMWEWIAKTGEHKSEWPGWKRNGGKIAECVCFCPCCQYVGDNKFACDNCPLTALWSKGGGNASCTNVDSPYFLWGRSFGKTANKHATRIANFAKRGYFKNGGK